jgi:cation:H+ antiporter
MMELFFQFILLFISLAVLARASHFVIDSSSKIASVTGLGELVTGFIILAIASSIPEIAVAISSILSENIGISLGDIFGSNTADICLVVGLMSLLSPIVIFKRTVKKISTMLFLTCSISLLLLTGIYLPRIVGLILILTFFFFCWYSVKERLILQKTKKRREKIRIQTILILFLALSVVLISSRLVVDSAARAATILGISEAVIGATIIGLGTTLPEIAVGITAVRKGHIGLALGDVGGSVITTVTLILGLILLISPIAVDLTIFSTLIGFMVLSSILLWVFFGRGKLGRVEGIILLSIYVLFIITTFGIQIVRIF